MRLCNLYIFSLLCVNGRGDRFNEMNFLSSPLSSVWCAQCFRFQIRMQPNDLTHTATVFNELCRLSWAANDVYWVLAMIYMYICIYHFTSVAVFDVFFSFFLLYLLVECTHAQSTVESQTIMNVAHGRETRTTKNRLTKVRAKCWNWKYWCVRAHVSSRSVNFHSFSVLPKADQLRSNYKKWTAEIERK